ncbi:hypothetical protein [Eggerthella sinensis]|uniref:hypothetical protein n=1 Tax=Eggerthella sinensis TaxID=242230 RepID=UPI0022E45444|nr:hypothetical protein [Eggerthella sinensis]
MAVAAESAFPPPRTGKPIEAKVDPKTGDVSVNEDVIVRYSGCVGCYQACGNRVKLDRKTGRVLGVGATPTIRRAPSSRSRSTRRSKRRIAL